MYALATCTASILRGTTTDEYGDAVDASTVAHSGVNAQILDNVMRVYDPSTQTPRIVRSYICHMQSGTDVRIGDRLRDDTHDVVYIIENVTQANQAGLTVDLILDLRRIT